jgi:nicotinate-nucleotide pyrophosphorylase (carboxylating)
VPPGQKDATRAAIAVGGADLRICPPPFVYLDKNYVTMLGGVGPALTTATAELPGHRRVVQVGTPAAALEAARLAADIVFVDTGRSADLRDVAETLRRHRLRDRVQLAFGGNVHLRDLDALRRSDADIIDVGRAIVDAPLLDLHLRITEGEP